MTRRRLLKNALWNVATGASAAAFTFVVPILLSHRVSATDLSIWSILLQASAYVALFTFGIQSVLSRHVAISVDGDHRADEARSMMDTAIKLLVLAAIIYVVAGGLVAAALGRIYLALPEDRLLEAQWALLVYVVAQSTQIPLSAIAGYFFGIQRNGIVAVNAIGSKVAMAMAIAWASAFGILIASLAAGVILLAFNVLLWWQYRLSAAKLAQGADSPPRQEVRRTLIRECLPISVWAIATFLIYGGTTSLASWFDFNRFPAYTMASGAAMLLLGLHSAAFGPFIPHVAVAAARGGAEAVGVALRRGSSLSVAISLVTLGAFALVGKPLVELVAPLRYQDDMARILELLLLGNSIRLVGLPYANTLIALGLQGKILWTPVIEAGATCAAALVLGMNHGLTGVAAGMAVGGAASLVVHFLFNMRLTRSDIPVNIPRLLLSSIGPIATMWLLLHLLGRGVRPI